MVNWGLRPLFENPRLSRCAHSHSSVRRANINFFTLIFFTCAKDFAQEEGRNVVKLLLYSEDYWQTFAAHNDNSKLLELFTPLALRRNPRQMLDSHQTLLLMSIHLKKKHYAIFRTKKNEIHSIFALDKPMYFKKRNVHVFFFAFWMSRLFSKTSKFHTSKTWKIPRSENFQNDFLNASCTYNNYIPIPFVRERESIWNFWDNSNVI